MDVFFDASFFIIGVAIVIAIIVALSSLSSGEYYTTESGETVPLRKKPSYSEFIDISKAHNVSFLSIDHAYDEYQKYCDQIDKENQEAIELVEFVANIRKRLEEKGTK